MARITLTEEIAQKLEFYWQLAGDTLSDLAICQRVGISFGQLRGWLRRDSKPLRRDGTSWTEGLRAIRTRAKVSTMTGYLVKLNQLAEEARAGGDFKTAVNVYCWLLERQFPDIYGNRAQPPEGEQTGKTGVMMALPKMTVDEWQEFHKTQTST
ncbi:MAG: hypothetical protein M1376_11295 [Planctomycetes bacterium]|nr:hypothetical protein [Planctomycetota bacterium]